MTGPALPQDPEGIAARAIWLVGAAIAAISAALVVIAWTLVSPAAATRRPVTAASPLERTAFERADGGAALHAAAAARLEHCEWIDRRARVARIPIDLAIDAVAADPELIAAGSPAIAAPSGGRTSDTDRRSTGTTELPVAAPAPAVQASQVGQ